jgi:hypothetical protein
VLEVKGGWDVVGQQGAEVDLVNTGLEHAALNVKDLFLEFKELLAVLLLLMLLDGTSIFTFALVLGPVTNEGALLTALDLERDVGSVAWLHDFEVDQTSDLVAWFVEGVGGLELNLTLGERTSGVREEKCHLKTL